jgi:heme-degrading monooxygenase HmoA
MVTEHAVLQVRSGREIEFETAMQQAKPLIAASPGFVDIKVMKSAQGNSVYLLLVRWNSIADHQDGFRKSDRYQQWRALLHPFYDPMPQVGYFEEMSFDV